jgi:hypothetical protein
MTQARQLLLVTEKLYIGNLSYEIAGKEAKFLPLDK